MLIGVLSGPCQSSTTASSGPPAVLRTTCTCSTAGDWNDQVRRDLPCTFTHVFSIGCTCISGRASLLDFAGFWIFLAPLPMWSGLNTSRAQPNSQRHWWTYYSAAHRGASTRCGTCDEQCLARTISKGQGHASTS